MFSVFSKTVFEMFLRIVFKNKNKTNPIFQNFLFFFFKKNPYPVDLCFFFFFLKFVLGNNFKNRKNTILVF